MKIEIYGTGCPKCNALEKSVKQVVQELGIKAEIAKVSDIDAMVEKGIMTTPALVIDGEIVSAGRVPPSSEIKEMISERQR